MERYVKLYRDIEDIRDIWESLYSGGNEMMPFQSYEWNRNMAECYKSNTYTFLNYSVRYFVCFEDTQPIVIAPVALPRNIIKAGEIQILGQYMGLGGLNFIYGNEASDEDFRFIIEYITCTYRCEMHLCGLKESSKLSQFLSTYEHAEKTGEEKRFMCAVPASSEENRSLLNDKAGETADKIKSGEIKANAEIYYGYKFGKSELEKIRELKEKIAGEPESKAPKAVKNGLKTVKKIQRKVFQNKDPLISFSGSENFVYVRYVVDGNFAGFLYGITDLKGQCAVGNVAADPDYSDFCPESMMLYELTESGIENENLSKIEFSRIFGAVDTGEAKNIEKFTVNDYVIEAVLPQMFEEENIKETE